MTKPTDARLARLERKTRKEALAAADVRLTTIIDGLGAAFDILDAALRAGRRLPDFTDTEQAAVAAMDAADYWQTMFFFLALRDDPALARCYYTDREGWDAEVQRFRFGYLTWPAEYPAGSNCAQSP
jgi:hypothetical protein